MKARFGVKSDYTGLKRIGTDPLELIEIPLGDDVSLRSPALRADAHLPQAQVPWSVAAGMIMHIIGQMIHSHMEVV